MSAAQLFVLQQLRADETLSLSDLAARTLTDRTSVADVVDRLRTKGLVNRAADPLDRRRASVRITPKGRRLLSHAPQAPTTALVAALRRLEPRKQQALARSLADLTGVLGVADQPAPLLFAESDKSRRTRRKVRGAEIR